MHTGRPSLAAQLLGCVFGVVGVEVEAEVVVVVAAMMVAGGGAGCAPHPHLTGHAASQGTQPARPVGDSVFAQF